MKWQFKYMVDCGDGIVTTQVITPPSDDLTEGATDIWNAEVPGIDRDEQYSFCSGGWLMSVACVRENDE